MFSQFFCSRPFLRCAFAWAGLAVFVAHQLFRAWLKFRLNSWYEAFYDLLQVSVGSGYSFEDERAALRGDVASKLWQFTAIVAPAVVVHPLAGLVRNMWVLSWRLALVKAYLSRWSIEDEPVEGASQRVQEDTSRFAAGIHSVVANILESTLTLLIFLPLLYDLDPALMAIALASASGGLSISALVGRKLVGLEVENQKVEAAFRKELVVLETNPAEIAVRGPLQSAFAALVAALRENYGRLYVNFAALATWLSTFDQVMIVLPYAVVAPRLFADEAAITLGVLVKSTNAFAKVFDSVNVISENWMAVNEFRSVWRRLREFERQQGPSSTRTRALVHSEPPGEVMAELCL